MQHTTETKAFSSGESVRAIALRVMHMSGVIHHALRQLTEIPASPSSGISPYALLTEEYALRARANILLIEAERLARPDFPSSEAAVLRILAEAETAMSKSNSAEDMNELVTGLLLFTGSIISRRNPIIALLLENLHQTVTKTQGKH